MNRRKTIRSTAAMLLALVTVVLCVFPAAGTEPAQILEPEIPVTEDATVPEITEESLTEVTASPEETTTPAQTEEAIPEMTEETAPGTENTLTEPAGETLPDATEETLSQTETEHPPQITAGSLPGNRKWQPFFGLLHAHTDISDGRGSVGEAFACAAAVPGLDFFAVTDHSNSFDNASSGAIDADGSAVSREWAEGKAAAAAVTDESFVGLFGYEMTWQDDRFLGHINTFRTDGWISRNQKGYSSLKAYYNALTTVSGSISQFNHPGPDGDFEDFAHWSEEYDPVMALLEVGGEKGFDACDRYTRALDKGWHVAPTCSQNNHNGGWGEISTVRTVVLAETLTEESLYEAMAARRVYATEDANLALWYELDGHIMGSRIASGESHQAMLWIHDPDGEECTVDVIGDGGVCAASGEMVPSDGPLELILPGGSSYYYLVITQSDGDRAVTAPVWSEAAPKAGIAAFAAEEAVPVAGQTLPLVLQLYNNTMQAVTFDPVRVFLEGTEVYSETHSRTLEPGEGIRISFGVRLPKIGANTLRAETAGTVRGKVYPWQRNLTVSCRGEEMVSGILVDGSHGADVMSRLDNLKALASEANMPVTVFSGTMPAGAEVLVIPAPREPLEEEFVEKVVAFLREGGLLILCGSTDPEQTGELNRILGAAGLTARFRKDDARNFTQNDGSSLHLSTQTVNPEADLCAAVEENQYYSHLNGGTVDPGEGIWLVRGGNGAESDLTGEENPVLAAWEEHPEGGGVLLAGSFFLSDEAMPQPKNHLDPPVINRTILLSALGTEEKQLPVTQIRAVRGGKEGELFRIRGYAASGTANIHNRFADAVYLQDDSGGILLSPFTEAGIPEGTHLDVVGTLVFRDGRPELIPVQWAKTDVPARLPEPEKLSNGQAMDYGEKGDILVQLEAVVTAVTLTEDGKGVARFVLTDSRSDKAVVVIEEGITSGKFGTNTLASKVKVGRTVRAEGFVHRDENGITVLRVKNCDEVVHVPPVKRYNPYTGDRIYPAAGTGILSLGLLVLLLCAANGKKKQGS